MEGKYIRPIYHFSKSENKSDQLQIVNLSSIQLEYIYVNIQFKRSYISKVTQGGYITFSESKNKVKKMRYIHTIHSVRGKINEVRDFQ